MTQDEQNSYIPSQQTQETNMGLDILGGLRHNLEQQLHTAIDQFAPNIPGGSNMTQCAKNTTTSILENLEKQAHKRFEDLINNQDPSNK